MSTLIKSLIGRGVTRMTAFASILFSLVTDIGFISRNRLVTVTVALAVGSGGLAADYFYGTTAFYSYIAILFLVSMVTKGWISSRTLTKDSN